MARVPKSLRRRIWGLLCVVLMLSAGAHAAFLAAAANAYPQTLVRVPADDLYIVACFPTKIPVVVSRLVARTRIPRWPSTPLSGRWPEDNESAYIQLARRVHAVFDRHQADLDRCTGEYGDWHRPDAPYTVHVEVKEGRFLTKRLRIGTRERMLRACLEESIRRWDDWPMEPERIVVDISRRLRRR